MLVFHSFYLILSQNQKANIMKTVALMILLLSSLPIYSTLSDKVKVIELDGEIERTQSKSLSFPLEVYIEGKSLFVQFYMVVTDVEITLAGSKGEIECRTVSFTEFQTEYFYIDDYTQGTYRIMITTPRGTNLYGTFYIE